MSAECNVGNVPPGYKQTDVGVIPEDWDIQPLGSLADVTMGQSPVGSSYNKSGVGLPLINGPTEFTKKYPVKVQWTSEPTKTCRKDDLLLCVRGSSTGRTNVSNDEYCIGRGIAAIRAKPSSNTVYLTYQIHLGIEELLTLSAGSTFPNVDGKSIRSIKIPIPPTKAEQETIAEALSDADTLIEFLEQLITKKRQIKQGAMQELLTGKRRLPGFSGEWEVKKLGDLATIQRGASPRPIDSPVWFDDTSSIGWVRISDVTRTGMFLRETTQRLSSLGVQHSRPVSSGSLIMSICATVGRPVITEIDICIHDGFVVFDGLRVDKGLLYYILKSIEDDWSRHGQTGSQMNLNTGLINQTKITIPPTREEQTAIASILSDMDSEITALEEKLAKARQLKQGMMQELLTGKIRLI